MATARKTKHVTKPTRKTAKHTTPARKATSSRAPHTSAVPASNGRRVPAAASKTIASQKMQLEKERAQVENELATLRAELQEAPEMTGDEVDLNVYEREKTLGLVATYERRLEEIDAALRAAAKGQYGICERCGKPIDPERLKIFPETRLCVSCKNLVEKEQRRTRI